MQQLAWAILFGLGIPGAILGVTAEANRSGTRRTGGSAGCDHPGILRKTRSARCNDCTGTAKRRTCTGSCRKGRNYSTDPVVKDLPFWRQKNKCRITAADSYVKRRSYVINSPNIQLRYGIL